MSVSHRNRRGSILIPSFLLIAVAAFLLVCGSMSFAGELLRGDTVLIETYHRISGQLEANSFGVPLYLESSDREGRLHGDVYGIFNHPFNGILDVLKVPANWCEIVSLHPNIKACTYREFPATWRLTFYAGRKEYQSLEDTHKFMYQYRSIEQLKGYVDIVLTADEGPFGTKDHRMRFEAIPLDETKTFVHVSYDYSYGLPLSLAEKLYFATLGRGKVGFTVSRTDSKGNPVYITGARGAIERNAVRFYFAIQSFMDTLSYPAENRFVTRINEWYDLTCRFRKQLFEMDKRDYLALKTREHQNQIMLQQRSATALQ